MLKLCSIAWHVCSRHKLCVPTWQSLQCTALCAHLTICVTNVGHIRDSSAVLISSVSLFLMTASWCVCQPAPTCSQSTNWADLPNTMYRPSCTSVAKSLAAIYKLRSSTRNCAHICCHQVECSLHQNINHQCSITLDLCSSHLPDLSITFTFNTIVWYCRYEKRILPNRAANLSFESDHTWPWRPFCRSCIN